MHQPLSPPQESRQARSHREGQAMVRVTLIGALLDLLLGLLKIVVGVFSASFALVSDGIHSLSDLLSDGFVLLMAKLARREPDAGHPYGHGRFETLGTLLLAMVLFGVAAVIAYDSLRRFQDPAGLPRPGLWALGVAALSIIGKEWIYRYTRRVAREVNSSLLLANAWHSRSDALSSIAVLIGVAGARLGYLWMDLLAALFVALIIGHIAWQLLVNNLNQLLDAALPEAEMQRIEAHLKAQPGIDEIHALRSRQHGSQTFLDLHLKVPAQVSVSEGHYLGERLCHSLRQAFPHIHDVVVHVDPDMDEDGQRPMDLPLRHEVLTILQAAWQEILPKQALTSLTLHYLDPLVDVEVVLALQAGEQDLAGLESQLRQALPALPWLGSLRFLYIGAGPSPSDQAG